MFICYQPTIPLWYFQTFLENKMKIVMKDIFLRLIPRKNERMKIEKREKLVATLHDKTECVIHIRNLKQALNQELFFLKIHSVIKFNQNAWLKPYIDMNTDLRKKAKNAFEKDSSSWKIIRFWIIYEHVRKHRDIKLVTTERRRNYLVSEPNYDTTNFSQNIY